MRVFLGSDHAGFELKARLIEQVRELGHEPVDCGALTYDPEDDYPAPCIAAAERTVAEPGSLGIVIGGSGNGEQIAANKVVGVRAALVWNDETSRLAREHNDANVMSIGARNHPEADALRFAEIFLATPFSEAPSGTPAASPSWRSSRRPAAAADRATPSGSGRARAGATGSGRRAPVPADDRHRPLGLGELLGGGAVHVPRPQRLVTPSCDGPAPTRSRSARSRVVPFAPGPAPRTGRPRGGGAPRVRAPCGPGRAAGRRSTASGQPTGGRPRLERPPEDRPSGRRAAGDGGCRRGERGVSGSSTALCLPGRRSSGRRESNPHRQFGRLRLCH